MRVRRLHGGVPYPRYMVTVLPEQLAARVRTVLRGSGHPDSAAGSRANWRTQRDRWMDNLDPQSPAELSEGDIRHLIDFLAESGPGLHSRMTAAEWRDAVDSLTPELLFAASR